ncbi:hypothetical protein ACGFZP_09040 [Kitasatospora sp. NPDC048239]|uniref:hypothetical protein n=1 Tax=Kitasatospora sp. NPDC048239 TaxID=3364046 RepID=UPI0037118B59
MRARPAVALSVLTALTLTAPVLAAAPATAAPVATAATAASGVGPGQSTTPAAFVPLNIRRLLDTRDARETPAGQARPLNPGESFDVPLSAWKSHPEREVPVVPKEATAVLVNVTVTNPSTDGYLTVRRDGDMPGPPATSTLNFRAGETISNTIAVAVAPPGSAKGPQINLYNNAGTTHVVVDVLGYYAPTGTDKYDAVQPTRLVDSRISGGRLGWGSIVSPKVATAELGTAGAKAVVLNVTAAEPSTSGFVTAYPSGEPYPSEGSNLNYAPGRTTANQVVVPVGADGRINVFNTGSTDLVVDIVGFYGPSGHNLFSAVTEQPRLLDTRYGSALMPFATRVLPVAGGNTGVPPTATAATLNVTVTGPGAGGHVDVFRADDIRPGTSSVNFNPGQTVANGVTSELGDVPGAVGIYLHSAAPAQAIVDLTGFFTAG